MMLLDGEISILIDPSQDNAQNLTSSLYFVRACLFTGRTYIRASNQGRYVC